MSRITRRAIAGITLALIVTTGAAGCSSLEDIAKAGPVVVEPPVMPETSPSESANQENEDDDTSGDALPGGAIELDHGASDYYTVSKTQGADRKGSNLDEITYCDLDDLGRATCAYVQLTERPYDEREDITFDTPGFTDNAETDIPALSNVQGSKDYHGWFWNRSHLIADSLGGDAVPENMITGTRTQNVGSTQVDGQYAGGMAYAEKIARDYIDSGDAASCHLFYGVTPNYEGDELVPRTVTVDIQNCDATIDQHIVVSNSANGFAIDYATGQWAQVP